MTFPNRESIPIPLSKKSKKFADIKNKFIQNLEKKRPSSIKPRKTSP
jgi:hypothetical protein